MERLKSLDYFRGLTVAGMILVNSPGTMTAYAPLDHAEWNGLTPTDLVFPFFLFIVGMSLAISLTRRLERGDSRSALLRMILRRTAILFGLGLLLNGFPTYDLSVIRIPGVLQRIALGYCAGSILFLWTSVRTQMMLAGLILSGYWLAMLHVSVPGIGPGVLTKEGNLAAYVDRLVFARHMYRPVYDPEGLLSTFPAITTVLLGIATACTLLSESPVRNVRRMTLFAAWLAVGGVVVNSSFPINKALWSTSFVLVTAGLALGIFALLYQLVDVHGWRPRAMLPFEALGQNAIAAYVLHVLFLKIQNLIHLTRPDGSSENLRFFITDHLFASWLSPNNASLAYALAYTALWTAVCMGLSRRRWVVKV